MLIKEKKIYFVLLPAVLFCFLSTYFQVSLNLSKENFGIGKDIFTEQLQFWASMLIIR